MSSQRSYFLLEFKALFLSSLGAVAFGVTDVFAGRTAILLKTIQNYIPWVFLIYPLLLTVRGDINGILTGKIGSALHLGTIEPRWIKNTKQFHELLSLIMILSFYDGIFISGSTIVASLLLNLRAEILSVFVITISTFFLGTLLSLVLTISLAFIVFRRNKDPDIYIYPIMSTVNDILITLIFFGVCVFYRPWNSKLSLYVGLPIVAIITGLIIFLQINFRKSSSVKSNILQSLPLLFVTTIIATVTGSVLSGAEMKLTESALLLVAYPAILTTVGSQDSIIVNTTTTKLHLGTTKPTILFFRSEELSLSLAAVMLSGVVISLFLSLLAVIIFPHGITLTIYFMFLVVLVLSNIISFIVISIIAIYTAFITYAMGLDPDNIVIPVLTSLADLATTSIFVFFAILLM